MGRHVVGNLTTVSTSVRDFTVTMLGYYFAERVAETKEAGDDLNVFLRWEQLAAYARGGVNGDWGFRGTERTKKNWDQASRLRLGVDSASLILSDQKTYGLWGLYSVPSRSSGLVEGSPTRLTPDTRRFVEEHYLPVLDGRAGREGAAIAELLSRRTSELRKDRDGALLDVIAKVLRTKFSSAERGLYRVHLVEGGPGDETRGGQRLLAGALEDSFAAKKWTLSPAIMGHLAKQCRREGSEAGLQFAEYLEQIGAAEQLLAPSVSLFGYLLSSDGQQVEDIARSVKRQWGSTVRSINIQELNAIESDLKDASGEPESARRWLRVAGALSEGDYAEAIRQLLVQNCEVMAMRGGAAPWAEIRDGKLHVKFAAETGNLPPKDELGSHWIHPYFIPSLRTIALELEP